MKKQCAVLTAAVMVCSLLTGCGSSRERKIKRMLKEKYGEEFTILKTWTQPLGTDVFKSEYHATAAPIDNQEAVFEITVTNFKEKTFEDTYPKAVVGKLLSDTLQSELSPYFGECYVHSWIAGVCPELDQMDAPSVEAYAKLADMTENKYYMSINKYYVAVNTSQYRGDDYEEEYDTIHDALTRVNTESGFDGDMRIYFLPNEKYSELINSIQIYGDFDANGEKVVEDYYGYGFGYNDGKWFSTVIKTIRATGISKEEYIKIRKEHD